MTTHTIYQGIFTDSLEYMSPVAEMRSRITAPESRDIERRAVKILVKAGMAESVVWNDAYLGTIVGGKLDGEQVYIEIMSDHESRWQDYR